MNHEVVEKIYEMLETIGEAIEYLEHTENEVLRQEIVSGRICVEEHINELLKTSVSEQINTISMSDADWLLAMYRVMDYILHPLQIKNHYDQEMLNLMTYVWEHSEEYLVDVMKKNLERLKQQSDEMYEQFVQYFARFPLWGTLNPKENDFCTFELRAAVLKQRSYDFIWLYKKLEDYLSKRTLHAILLNWAVLDGYNLAKIKSIFHDYYEPDIFQSNEEDVFVDVGAFIGDSILQYINMYGTKYNKIYAYEISKNSCEMLEKNTEKYHDVTIRCKGVGAENGYMYLSEHTDSSANQLVEENVGDKVEIAALDDDIEDDITFVKMDIEGAEQSALLGLRKTIEEKHPKLAICTYHGYEDIWKIPFMIDCMYSKYSFYLRHYGGNGIPTEFVLLCKPN